MVPSTRASIRQSVLQYSSRHMVCGMYLCGADVTDTLLSRGERHGPTQDDIPGVRDAYGRRLACMYVGAWGCENTSSSHGHGQGHTKLPDYVPVGQFPKPPMRDLFTAASADTLNLLGKCLVYEPRKRISALDVRAILLIAID